MVQPTSTPDLDSPSLSGFLHTLFHGLDGFIYSPTLDRETGEFTQIFVHTSHINKLEEHIHESSKRTDVYIAPAVFSEPKASKTAFKASNVVWCEFDGNSPETFGHEPTMVVQSSDVKHTHCYWLLDAPVIDYKALERINRGLTFTLEADKSGWDCTQILRPIGSFNYKRGVPVSLQATNAAAYNITEFEVYTAPAQIEEETIKLGQIPDVMSLVYKYAFTEEFHAVFTSNPIEGQRSSSMMRVAYMTAEMGLSNEEIYAFIYNYDERIRKYTDRTDRHRRLIDIIERARLKYPIVGPVSDDDFDAFEVLDVISFGSQTIEVSWFIPNLLQQAGNFLLVGPPGVGKTQVALNFAYGMATGTPVLDYEMDAPKRILFVSCEMGPVDLKVFTDQITAGYTKEQHALLSENLYVLPHGEPVYLNTTMGQQKLIRMIDVLKVDGFIFDSLGSATTRALSDEESTKALLDFNDRLRKELGVFSWYIHHNRKATENNKEPSGLADVYGSQYITARATTVLSLWPIQRNLLKVRELKKRLAAAEDDWYIQREEKHLRFRRTTYEAPKKSTIAKALETDDRFTM